MAKKTITNGMSMQTVRTNINDNFTELYDAVGAIPTVNDTLTSASATEALSAKQGKILKDDLDTHKADMAAHGISHKNLLYNWDFRNPLNQRGFTSTTAAGYTIDGWRLAASGHTVEVVSDGIKLIAGKNAGLNMCFLQLLENYENFEGKTLTLSVHIVENTLTQGCNLRWNDSAGSVIMGTGYFSYTFTPSSLSYLQIGVQFFNRDVDDGKYVIIDKMKLEIGNVSTLANDPPADYGAVAANTVQANLDAHKADNVTDSGGAHGLRIETGTWTPTLISLYGDSGKHTYSEQTGHYIKIGNLVHINCIMTLTAKDAAMTGTYIGIGGVPFSCPSRTSASLHGTRGITLPTDGVMIIPHVTSTQILLNIFASNSPTLGLSPANIADNMSISVAATYRV